MQQHGKKRVETKAVNPYAAPKSGDTQTYAKEKPGPPVPASKGLRFANLVIDQLVMFAGAFLFGLFTFVLGGEEAFEQFPDFVLGSVVAMAYYTLLEATTARSLGKLITGTKVVNKDGGTPSFGQILGRSACRLIPFEPFSFLGKEARKQASRNN